MAGIQLGTLKLEKVGTATRLFGLSEKGLYEDITTGERYFVKQPKAREIQAIFKGDPAFEQLLMQRNSLFDASVRFNEFTGKPKLTEDELKTRLAPGRSWADYQQIAALFANYARHVEELILSNTALEIIAPLIAQAIFGQLLVVPTNVFFISQEGAPSTASKSLDGLDEFLAKHKEVQLKNLPADWEGQTPPDFASLIQDGSRTAEESLAKASCLGQAFAVALLMGHLDLVNNINLSNFGTVEDPASGEKKLAIVDWGNCLGTGFSGLSAEEGAFNNPLFNDIKISAESKVEVQNKITGFEHVVPFDKEILPALPRQVVDDLFNLTETGPLREAQRTGFVEACRQAFAHTNFTHLFAEVIDHTIAAVPVDADREKFSGALPSRFQPKQQGAVDSLAHILTGRLQSLKSICHLVEKDIPMHDIFLAQKGILLDSQCMEKSSQSSEFVRQRLG